MTRTRSEAEFERHSKEVRKRHPWVMQLLDSVLILNKRTGSGGPGTALQQPAPAPNPSPNKGPRTMPRASTHHSSMPGPATSRHPAPVQLRPSSNRGQSSSRARATQKPHQSQATSNLVSPNTKALRATSESRNAQSNRDTNNLTTHRVGQTLAEIPDSNNTGVWRSTMTLDDAQGRTRAPQTKVPNNMKRKLTKLSKRQENGAMVWNRRWMEFRFPMQRLPLFDDITNSYLRLFEKVETNVQKWGSIYKNPSFRREIEGARDFHTTTEDEKTKKARLRQFPETFQKDLHELRVSEDKVFVLTDLALVTTTSGWNKRLIVPRPKTVNGRRLEPRKVASVICCVPHVGEPLPPWITFKVDRIKQLQDNFDGTPVCFTLDGWVEPFHLLDWVNLIFDPKTNPTGATGKIAPRRLLLLDGYKFPINPDFFITCWLKNIFCVCIARHGGQYFNPLNHGMFQRISDLYADWIMSQVEDEADETHEFKADPREFAATIRRIMAHSTVKKEIAVGWERTCLFRSEDKQAIRNLIDGEVVPESSGSSTSVRARLRPRPETPPQGMAVNLISPEPSTQRTQESGPCSPLAQKGPVQNDDDGLDGFISEDTYNSQSEEYVPSRECGFESAEDFPCDDFLLDGFSEFFHGEEDETVTRDAEASSDTVEPLNLQIPELAMTPESNNVIVDEDRLGVTTDDCSRHPTSPVMDSSDHDAAILSDEDEEDSQWCRGQKRKMLERLNSIIDATSPESKRRCKRKVMETYKEMVAAYGTLHRVLAAKSVYSGSDTQDPLPLPPVSRSDKDHSEREDEHTESIAHQATGAEVTSQAEDHGQAQADGPENGDGQANDQFDQVQFELQTRDEERRRKKREKRKLKHKQQKERREAEKRQEHNARILEVERVLEQERKKVKEREEPLRLLKDEQKENSQAQSSRRYKSKGRKGSSPERTKKLQQDKNWFQPRQQWQTKLTPSSSG
ncbi:uncharacterized protein N7496_008906 [Penicillium cataractarum]|uniref:DDE-1 domain-containing protein n=1 Tax=Penicillium cataractarum TaxID=2100454 RepID=A0A9W9V7H6_9EURO|nr:uncharacterized protein N7496_008906 [Penicillium cataractarum]KAJ5369146.1 hypothetical protein N7496_008906 [Penicillium cataractarum]